MITVLTELNKQLKKTAFPQLPKRQIYNYHVLGPCSLNDPLEIYIGLKATKDGPLRHYKLLLKAVGVAFNGVTDE